MILPEDPEKAEVERAWQEREGRQHPHLSPRPESVASYISYPPTLHAGGLPLPPPPYYNPNPFHAAVGAFSAEDVADSANVGVTGRRSRPVRRSRSPTASFNSSMESNDDHRLHTTGDPYTHLRHRNRTLQEGMQGDDREMSRIGGLHHNQALDYPSLSSTGFNAGAIISASAEEHRGFLDVNANRGEDSTLQSAETTYSNATQRVNKRKPRNKEWIAEPDVDAHKTVPEWNGTVSDLVRWGSAHMAASATAFQRRKWKRWSKKRWAVIWGIVLLLVGGVVGGIFGGLDIANKSKPPKLRMPGPDGSRVVVPWESSAALAFDPMKVSCLDCWNSCSACA